MIVISRRVGTQSTGHVSVLDSTQINYLNRSKVTFRRTYQNGMSFTCARRRVLTNISHAHTENRLCLVYLFSVPSSRMWIHCFSFACLPLDVLTHLHQFDWSSYSCLLFGDLVFLFLLLYFGVFEIVIFSALHMTAGFQCTRYAQFVMQVLTATRSGYLLRCDLYCNINTHLHINIRHVFHT